MTKILIDEAVVRQALEALELVTWTNNPPVNKAITAIREALANAEQPAQEPDPDELTIAYLNGIDTGKKRKPLTDEQIKDVAASCMWWVREQDILDDAIELARAIEAAHGIKGNT